MALSPGSKLGSYEVLAALGAGGMGEVYRGRDTRLGREVAIKVLPAERLADESRRRRFVQEARAASALNHPNIVTIHEIESADGIDFIVMEYVAGQTLDRLVPKSGMPVSDALRLAIPIADAVAAAHAKGIVHRDLKPANVIVSREGMVKVLDFGLAKLAVEQGDETLATETEGVSAALTRSGMIVGTAGYMSPEQATGGKLDARSDIFSFGATLYEMVTGRRAFGRGSRAETLAALLQEEPKPPSSVVSNVPRQLERLIQRCLSKDPARRAQHMSDVMVELKQIHDEQGSPVEEVADSPMRRWPIGVAAAVTALSLAAALGLALRRAPSQSGGSVTRFSIPLPEGTQLAEIVPSVAISRDGSKIVVAVERGRAQELHLRELAGSEWKRLAASGDASSPFFSPDGSWVGFFTAGNLNRVSVAGGNPQVVCAVTATQRRIGNTAVWGEDGWITYAGWPAPGLWRCPSAGGTREQLNGSESAAGSRPVIDSGPIWLPGGSTVLFGAWTAGKAEIEALSLAQARRRVVIGPASSPSYAGTGHLLLGWDNQILAVPFDANTLGTRGAPLAVVDGVRMGVGFSPRADYAVSDNGTLVYFAGRETLTRLVTTDRTGRVAPLPLPSDDYRTPALSPDGQRVAVEILRGAGRDVWIADLRRGSVSRLTSDEDSTAPLWSPDGNDIVYTSSQPGQYNLFKKGVDRGGAPARLTTSAHAQLATSWAPDGRALLFNDVDPQTKIDVWVLSLNGAQAPSPLLNTPARELSASFSPDGEWIAFQSDESGRFEIYVQSFPQARERRQVSNDGGIQPFWNKNGRELMYLSDDRVVSVAFDTRQGLRLGRPEVLFRRPFSETQRPWAGLAPDGSGFVFLEDATPSAPPTRVEVVVNWFQELKQRVPIAR